MDWTPFHSAEGVWSEAVPHDPTNTETEPKVTLKPLPALSSILKLVLKETQSDPEYCWRVELAGGDARGLAKTEVVPINIFV